MVPPVQRHWRWSACASGQLLDSPERGRGPGRLPSHLEYGGTSGDPSPSSTRTSQVLILPLPQAILQRSKEPLTLAPTSKAARCSPPLGPVEVEVEVKIRAAKLRGFTGGWRNNPARPLTKCMGDHPNSFEGCRICRTVEPLSTRTTSSPFSSYRLATILQHHQGPITVVTCQ